jgi:protein CpxP
MTKAMRWIGLGIGAVVLGLSAVASVSAQGQDGGQPPSGRGGRGPGGPGGRMGGPGGPMGVIGIPLDRLNPTEAQREQVKSIVDSHQTELRSLGQKAMTARRALDLTVTADSIDEGAIRSRAADLAAVESDVAVLRARVHADVLQILTSDQKARLKELQAEREKRAETPRPPRR